MKEIGQRLCEERQRLGYSQQFLAQAGGVTVREQRQYELGEDLPRADYLAQLAGQGVDVVYVVTGKRSTVVNISRHQAQTLMDNRVVGQEVSLDGPPEEDLYFKLSDPSGPPPDQS
ncbi:helix-turn-helix transcriptional regulator [Pseudomonas fluorescens]|uniref:Helix-turn-helix transcriptional regulator n=1 Tax=Pseudomonas fluorescens TaxID=294 RepID=A0AAE2U1C4_PSEFL|nr:MULTISPECIES: helix-turn-helix domain-containing protein [Pseudomonas fluorescens group]MBA1428439.1 helix-turn-helix transcriptional regulator [Pseudomonas orientalis]MBD8148131.1 helix-turn-helix transcriptional regulator [Pseudomonas fluorescens]MBD8178262.1 helix-turn-helix transcriptional regulator [Pseudomonas fluorescens]MBD8269092.1 helix-turn-helix transcriptional regulator [Pseudomonas fluorescens]MBD8747537.1 helix-turn-helix transcriptional regulator [Pseudomonas fluorescens]